ncbi:FCP1 [Hepatospora eriocheir]|uniref:protein-serine/threonine phosphatase n=1 Tax=Hepatospora eriocheir TaxID=1081669 RepID=A0A1X0QIR4_9MICR|nr:FCP1 [Hepatospora eriocheir]
MSEEIKKIKNSSLELSIEQEIDSIFEGSVICDHSLRIGGLCANCGESIRNDQKLATFDHTNDAILLTQEFAEEESFKLANEVHNNKKMVLLLDLDQTLLHTKVVSKYDLHNKLSIVYNHKFILGDDIHYVKYRPYLFSFLNKLSKLYELHVYTMGTRLYAQAILAHIDPEKKYFGNRVVTRTENLRTLYKSIKRITTVDKNVLSLDDRLDVWNFIPNTIVIKPFYYYNRIDINDPNIILWGVEASGENEKEKEMIKEITEKIKNENLLKIKEDYNELMIKDINSKIKINGEIKTEDDLNKEMPKRDKELCKIYKLFKNIHRSFFGQNLELKDTLHIKNFVKLKIFKGYVFNCSLLLEPFILFMGGTVTHGFEKHRDKNIFVIQNELVAKSLNTVSLSQNWIYDCLYERKFLDITKYILKDYRL